jgi:hypothetical protein
MIDWRHLKIEGLGPVSRQVALFQVGPPLSNLPLRQLQGEGPRAPRRLVPRGAERRSEDGSPDWIAGLGASIEEALEDTLRWFARSTEAGGGTTEGAFVWAAPEEF